MMFVLSNESEAVSIPGVRMIDEEDGKELGAEDRACYRSWTVQTSHLSQDKLELQFAVKKLVRRMQQPNTKNMQALKRLVRFDRETKVFGVQGHATLNTILVSGPFSVDRFVFVDSRSCVWSAQANFGDMFHRNHFHPKTVSSQKFTCGTINIVPVCVKALPAT